jgi:FecR protein
MKRYFVTLLTVLVMSLIPVVTMTAQEPGQGQSQDRQSSAQPQVGQQQDPQTGVGRISVINGDVSTQRGDSGDWVADTVNTPVAPGDTLSTATRSRTEVQLDYADALRLDHDTQARVADLSNSRIQVQVANGLADYAILRDGGPSAEIDTPNVAVHPLGRGVYRIQVISPTETYVTVREGEAQVSTPQGSTNVTKGQTITVQGSDNPQYKVDEAQARDDWDHWNADRDKTILNAQSWRHTDPYYTGSENLDAYGQWHNVPGYGDVWQPTQPPGWAPYSDGSWVWEPDWGYTWVSAEPWGWAPYHYGRWFLYNNAWSWWPGPIGGFGFGGWYRPIWAPAYVNFFGFGGLGFGFSFGFGGGFGFGSIGWLPVGPCDPFFPWWGRGWGWGGRGWGGGWGRNGFNTVNVRNITNINDFRNMHGAVAPLAGANRPQFSNLQGALSNPRIRGAISTVAGNKFGQGRAPVAHGVTSEMLHNSSFVTGRMPVEPTKAGLSASSRGPAASSIPRAGSIPTHFAGTQGTSANRGSFTQGGRQATENGRQTASGASRSFSSPNNANSGQTVPGSSRRGQVADGASRSFGSAGTNDTGRMAPQAARSNPASQAGVNGWQRFAGHGSPGTAGPGSSFAANRPESRGFSAPSRTAPQVSGNGTRSGWQSFSSQPAPRSSFASPGRSESGFGSRSVPGGYNSSARSYGSGGPSPQMNRPMFSSRSAPSYGGNSGRQYSYSAPRSAPSYGGGNRGLPSSGYSAPRSYGGYGAGRSSGGHFDGGHSGGSGGGGGHSGGHGGGGHSGGGRHGGGGGRH